MTDSPIVGVLYDSMSDNIGDIAMLDAARDGLAPHDITDVRAVDLFSRCPQTFDAIIVGGGELLRPAGDPFYDKFRSQQGCVLHAVGVWDDVNGVDHLRGYDCVSARTQHEARTLRRLGVNAVTTPCPTTLLGSEHVDLPPAPSGRRIAVHLVPSALREVPHLVELVNDIPGDHLLVPFTRYNGDRDFMRALPLKGNDASVPSDLTPRQMRSVISQCDFVVASSLHMTLFALAYAVPFVSYRQPKVWHYLKDRGLEELTFNDDESLVRALDAALASRTLLERAQTADVEACRAMFACIADTVRRRAATGVVLAPTASGEPGEKATMLAQQAVLVRDDRDRLINALFSRHIADTGEIASAMRDISLVREDLAATRQKLAVANRYRGALGTVRHCKDAAGRRLRRLRGSKSTRPPVP